MSGVVGGAFGSGSHELLGLRVNGVFGTQAVGWVGIRWCSVGYGLGGGGRP